MPRMTPNAPFELGKEVAGATLEEEGPALAPFIAKEAGKTAQEGSCLSAQAWGTSFLTVSLWWSEMKG